MTERIPTGVRSHRATGTRTVQSRESWKLRRQPARLIVGLADACRACGGACEVGGMKCAACNGTGRLSC